MGALINCATFTSMKPKTIHFIIAGVFVLFAAVQYNDPDPLLWILIYGAVALVALAKIYLPQVDFSKLILTFLVLYALYAILYIPSFLEFLDHSDKANLVGKMKAEKPWIEGTRELGGLLIACGALWYLLVKKAL